eukprot:jgi/Psemu1/188038/e_gw1.73.117.1
MPNLTRAERDALLLPNEVIRQGSKTIVVNRDDAATGNEQQYENDNNNDNNNDNEQTTGVLVLYTQLGGISFATFYRTLVENEIPFVVRHMGSEEEDQPFTSLQGYGVRLDIRNVEYKVFDDDKKRDSAADETAGIDACRADESPPGTDPVLTTHFLGGVNLTALLGSSSPGDGVGDDDHDESHPAEEVQRQLWKLHARFEQHSQLIPPTWQRRHLSIQAATVIAQSPHPLVALQDVSQNLPSVASTLVHVTVPEDYNKVAESMESALQRLIRTSGGGLWINGRPVSIERPSFNVFDLIQLLQDEVEELENLERRLKPVFSSNKNNTMNGLKRDTSEGMFRIDLATGDNDAVIYMNDLEKDRGYSGWGTSVKNMIMAMQYGMPPSVRRNLFTVLLVDDPLGEDTQDSILAQSFIGQLVQQQFPVRLAMVIVS